MRRLLASGFCLILCIAANSQSIRIVSDPAGATVEIDGKEVGTTPYESKKMPGGYFHKTATAFGKRLGTSGTAVITKQGYVTKTIELTRGPYPWLDLNGSSHGDFYLIKSDEFTVKLTPVDSVFKGTPQVAEQRLVRTSASEGTRSIEDIVDGSNDSVLRIETTIGHGTGFLITTAGVVATNAHVVGQADHVIAKTVKGQTFNGEVVYRDSALDLALIKLDVAVTPSLTFGDASLIRVGEDAIAIGNPAMGMQNTVTRGIVSAVGPEPDYGAGTFVQTDAAINPGNSGGPLFNRQGQVIGMNTFKAIHSASGASLQSLGFALSSSDIVAALSKVFPNARSPQQQRSDVRLAQVNLKSNAPDGEIFVDGKFVGNVGSAISLPVGDHKVEVRADKYHSWERVVSVNGSDSINLNATLVPQ